MSKQVNKCRKEQMDVSLPLVWPLATVNARGLAYQHTQPHSGSLLDVDLGTQLAQHDGPWSFSPGLCCPLCPVTWQEVSPVPGGQCLDSAPLAAESPAVTALMVALCHSCGRRAGRCQGRMCWHMGGTLLFRKHFMLRPQLNLWQLRTKGRTLWEPGFLHDLGQVM